MKVLTITSSFPRYMGDYYGNFIYALCRTLTQKGINVVVLAPPAGRRRVPSPTSK